MAVRFVDSWDHYATGDFTEKWTQVLTGSFGAGAAPTLDIGAFGRRSSNGMRGVAGGVGLTLTTKFPAIVLATSGATFVTGFAWTQANDAFTSLHVGTAIDSLSNNAAVVSNALVVVRQGTVTQGFLRVNTNGTLSYLRGPTGSHTVLGTTGNALLQGTTYYIELQVKIDNSTGTVDIKVNGISWLALTAQDTQATASATWDEVWVNKVSGTAGVQWDMDDLYVSDGSGAAPWNTFLGDCRVDPRYGTAPGATAGWTPSTGANWENVDEAPPNDDTDYNSGTTAGVTDTFVTQNAPAVGATIYAVQHCLNMKKTDAGLCTVAPVIRHSGVDYVGADLAPGLTYAYHLQIAQTNPGTGAAWVEADYNAAEFGYKRTA